MDYSYPFHPAPEKRNRAKRKQRFIIFSMVAVVSLVSLVSVFASQMASSIPVVGHVQTALQKVLHSSEKAVLSAVSVPTAVPTPIPTYTLSGNVFVDANLNRAKDSGESGYVGTRVSVTGPTPATTTTDSNGNYTFTGLQRGTYTVTATLPGGYKNTTPDPTTVSLTANQSVNFGIMRTLTVSGRIFLDNNRNTSYDTTDGNYVGGTVTFAGTQSTSANTNADGMYTAQVFEGNYTVSINHSSNYEASTPISLTRTITADQSINFGLIPLFRISGAIFEDTNQDGKKGSGDSVAAGITVNLSGAATATTTTDSNGRYAFANLYAGNYTVSYVLPTKKKNTTTVTQTASFAAPTSAGSSSVSEKTNVDFGVVTVYDIVGRVFVDSNSNGVINSGEPYYSGARVTLTGTSPGTATSNSTGNYSFLEKPSGTYTIAIDIPSGYRSTTVNNLNLTINADQTINFGIVQGSTSTVGGVCTGDTLDIVMIFDHSNSMNDRDPSTGRPKMEVARPAAVGFVDVVAQSLPNARIGVVQFAGSHNYPNSTTQTSVVAPLSSNFAQARNAINNIQLTTNGSGTCYDCAIDMTNNLLRNTGRAGVQRMVVFMTDGISSTRIGLNGGIQEDANGQRINENAAMQVVQQGVNQQNIIYNVIGFGSGSEINEPFMNQIADTNNGVYLNSPRGGTIAQIYQRIADTTIGTGIINGTLFHDRNTNKTYDAGDSPLPNWTVNARTPGVTNPITATTNASGNYTLTGLCTRNYTVSPTVKSGWYQTTDRNSYTINIVSGNTYNNFDFGYNTGFTISGSIFEDQNRDTRYASPDTLHLRDTTILFTGPATKTVTTSNGLYNSGPLPPGEYTVSLFSPLTTGYTMTHPLNGPPPSFQVTIGPGCSTNGSQGGTCE